MGSSLCRLFVCLCFETPARPGTVQRSCTGYFYVGYKNITRFQGNSSERTWLTAILKNKLADFYRKNILVNPHTGDVSTEEHMDRFFAKNGHWENRHAPQSWGVEAVSPLEDEELQAVLKRYQDNLPHLWAMVMSRKYMEDEDSKDIYKELDLTPFNFWVIVHRAKLNLRACIGKNWKRE